MSSCLTCIVHRLAESNHKHCLPPTVFVPTLASIFDAIHARPMSPRYHQAVSSPNSSLSVSGLDDWGNPTNQESCHILHCQPQPRWTLTVAMSGTWPLQRHRTDADINTFPILVVSRYFSRPWQNPLKQRYNPCRRQQRMIMPPLLLTDYTQPPPKLILTSSSQRHSPRPFQDCIHLSKHLITSTRESTM